MSLSRACLGAEGIRGENLQQEMSASEINEAVHALLAHPAFTKSIRLRELFLFLKDQYIVNGGLPMKGEEIAARFFNRQGTYSETDDPIVRTNISRLRTALLNVAESDPQLKYHVEIPPRSYALKITRKKPSKEVQLSPFYVLLVLSLALNILLALWSLVLNPVG